MYSVKTLITLLLAAAPIALAACNEPIGTGENPNCWGGNFESCVAVANQECVGECWNTPVTGAGGPCHTGCRIRVEQQCGGWCKGVYDCDSCKAALKTQGAADDDEGLEDACSEEGDMYYCNCD